MMPQIIESWDIKNFKGIKHFILFEIESEGELVTVSEAGISPAVWIRLSMN